MLEAIIFDMDGLLIDSEPFWQEAQINVFSLVDIFLDHDMCIETTGIRIHEVVNHWYKRFPWDLSIYSPENITDKIIEQVIDLISRKGEVRRGVNTVLEFVKSKNVKIALASSSDLKIIEVVLAKLAISDYFQVIHSAEFETFGKPHPAIYLSTAKKLIVDPSNCLVFEDSIAGLIAAKSAKMHCIAIPEYHLKTDPRFGIADDILPSLDEFNEPLWKRFNSK